MTTGAYFNRLGEQRITTALLVQATDNAARRAAAWWTLGSKARYALAANRGQFAKSGKDVRLYYGHPSFWGYHIRFRGLGEPRITTSLLMRTSTDPTRKAAQQWTFGKLRSLSVGADRGVFLLNGKAVNLVSGATAASSVADWFQRTRRRRR